jgi:dihydrofolate reductase
MQTALSLIVAMTLDHVIGRNAVLPWNLPSDLERFKEITTRIGTVIVGRATYESILARNGTPLPGRHHIVLTRRPLLVWADSLESVTTAGSIEEALASAKKHSGGACIIGGEQIYEQFFPFVQTLFITNVHASIEGDAFFRCSSRQSDWKCTYSLGPRLWNVRDSYPTSFDIYEKTIGA